MTSIVVSIRSTDVSDAEWIARLAGQLGYPTTPAQARERLEKILAVKDNAIFVAEAGQDGVVGWVHVHSMRLLEAEPYAEVGGLVVDAAHRSLGIGERLLEAGEAWARVNGYNLLRARSSTLRERAHKFYHRMGYELVKTQHSFVKSLKPDLIKPHTLAPTKELSELHD